MFSGVVSAPDNEPIPEIKEISTLILIQENSLLGQTSTENPPVTLTNGFRDLIYAPEIVFVLDKIITCESGGNYKAENPTSGAWGLCQMLPSTQINVEKKWGLEIDWNSSDDQLYACYRLLMEEGTKHWNETKGCWSK